MPQFIIRVNDNYYMWNPELRRPETEAMTLNTLESYILKHKGAFGIRDLPDRLRRVDSKGCSAMGYSLDELIKTNKAGRLSTHLNKESFYKVYGNIIKPKKPKQSPYYIISLKDNTQTKLSVAGTNIKDLEAFIFKMMEGGVFIPEVDGKRFVEPKEIDSIELKINLED